MNSKLKEKTQESLAAVLPITIIVLFLSVFVVPLETGIVALFLFGAMMLIVGMGLFSLGVEISMTPLGEGVGVNFSKTRKLWMIILVSFIIGVVITIAEPDLQVLANQVSAIPNMMLIITVSIGVGLMLVVAVLRILFKFSLSNVLFALYLILFIVSIFTPSDFLAVSFDSGGVTTGPITVPFIMAFGIGLASIRGDENASDDSFGLVAICSVGPILSVLLLGIFYNPGDTIYSPVEITTVITMRDVVHEFVKNIPLYLHEVLISILPVVAVFFVFQLFTRRFQKMQFIRLVIGMIYTYLGLVLFLCGVNVGFAPVGSLIGSELASTSFAWILIPIGLLIGYYIVKAEPAVQVLNHQVQELTNGSIPAKAMNRSLSIGVAASVGLSMLRVITGLSIYWILIPGYIISLVLSRVVPKIFVGIAFDSGGVASGPMATTFLLPLAMGACDALGGNMMLDAFGVVAMVALTPLIAVQLMGLIFVLRERKAQELSIDDESDEILDLEEDI